MCSFRRRGRRHGGGGGLGGWLGRRADELPLVQGSPAAFVVALPSFIMNQIGNRVFGRRQCCGVDEDFDMDASVAAHSPRLVLIKDTKPMRHVSPFAQIPTKRAGTIIK